MARLYPLGVVALVGAAVLLITPELSLAQYGGRTGRSSGSSRKAKGGASEILKIDKFVGLEKRERVKTPEYRSNYSSSLAVRKEWGQLAVEYETGPEWIDELSFTYYVLLEKKEGSAKTYAFMKKLVRYIDIEKGDEHKSTVYIHSKALERYGDIVAMALEVRFKNELVAQETEVGIKMPADWWTNPLVIENENVVERSSYLLNRAESPFSLVNIDDYEVIP